MLFRSYLLTFINIEVLSNVVIPTIVNQVFTDKGMYKYRILNIDRQQVIFASDDSPNSAYNRPDFSWVFFSGPNPYNSGLYTKITPKWNFPVEDYNEEADASFDILKNHVRKITRTEFGKQQNTVFQGTEQIVMEVVHKDGSVIIAARNATRINTMVSIFLVIILIFGILILQFNMVKAQKLARKQQEFIATITHELKTPISVISLSAQNMKDGIVTNIDKIKTYGGMIQKESSRLQDTVDYFLLYSGISSGISRPKTKCNMNQMIEDILERNKEILTSLNFNIDVTMPDENVFLLCDKAAIY